MGDRYTSMGKEVLRDGQHFADTNSNQDAADVADAMNVYHFDDPIMPELTTKPGCRAYQASDQMMCPCGRQWDINDPDPPTCPNG